MTFKKIEINDIPSTNPLAEVITTINDNTDALITALDNLDDGNGVIGPAGPKGDPGNDGREGPAGKDGKDGTNGVDGQDGKDGLPGATGAKGETGAQGIQGVPGKDGKDGLTGAQGPQGVSGANGVGIKGFTSGYVNAGAFVTLDNIKVSVTTTGNRGLSLAAVTGSFNAHISATFGYVSGVGGNATTQTYTYNTTPSGSLFGYGFPNAGDGSVYLINDITNYRFYRVTLMIGPGYTNNFISIERLI